MGLDVDACAWQGEQAPQNQVMGCQSSSSSSSEQLKDILFLDTEHTRAPTTPQPCENRIILSRIYLLAPIETQWVLVGAPTWSDSRISVSETAFTCLVEIEQRTYIWINDWVYNWCDAVFHKPQFAEIPTHTLTQSKSASV